MISLLSCRTISFACPADTFAEKTASIVHLCTYSFIFFVHAACFRYTFTFRYGRRGFDPLHIITKWTTCVHLLISWSSKCFSLYFLLFILGKSNFARRSMWKLDKLGYATGTLLGRWNFLHIFSPRNQFANSSPCWTYLTYLRAHICPRH